MSKTKKHRNLNNTHKVKCHRCDDEGVVLEDKSGFTQLNFCSCKKGQKMLRSAKNDGRNCEICHGVGHYFGTSTDGSLHVHKWTCPHFK